MAWYDHLEETIVVNTRTKKETESLLMDLLSADLSSRQRSDVDYLLNRIDRVFNRNGSDLCIRIVEDRRLGFSSFISSGGKTFYERCGYEIISYEELVSPEDSEPAIDLIEFFNLDSEVSIGEV